MASERSAPITPSAPSWGWGCHRLQMAPFIGCSQQWATHYREHSRWSWAAAWTFLSLEFNYLGAENACPRTASTLLCFGLAFSKHLRILSSSGQPRNKQTVPQDSRAVTQHFELKATYTVEPPHAQKGASEVFSLHIPRALTNLYRLPSWYSRTLCGGIIMRTNCISPSQSGAGDWNKAQST